jgi:hypothetical protein
MPQRRIQSRAGQPQHSCAFQYLSQRNAQPPLTIAHDTSPASGDTHQAAVRVPTPSPTDMQRMAGPVTSTWPSRLRPVGAPISFTRASRASAPLAVGHGWLGRQLSSISRAAMPANRIRGPYAHHTGPSPSHTRLGVQVNSSPVGTTDTASSNNAPIIRRLLRHRHGRDLRDSRVHRPLSE